MSLFSSNRNAAVLDEPPAPTRAQLAAELVQARKDELISVREQDAAVAAARKAFEPVEAQYLEARRKLQSAEAAARGERHQHSARINRLERELRQGATLAIREFRWEIGQILNGDGRGRLTSKVVAAISQARDELNKLELEPEEAVVLRRLAQLQREIELAESEV